MCCVMMQTPCSVLSQFSHRLAATAPAQTSTNCQPVCGLAGRRRINERSAGLASHCIGTPGSDDEASSDSAGAPSPRVCRVSNHRILDYRVDSPHIFSAYPVAGDDRCRRRRLQRWPTVRSTITVSPQPHAHPSLCCRCCRGTCETRSSTSNLSDALLSSVILPA